MRSTPSTPKRLTLTGGVRRRLEIRYRDGIETFIMNRLGERGTELRNALQND